MMPDKVQVLKATENGDEGTLIVAGVQDGQAREGTVRMMRQGGRWFVVRESWRN
jgi:hypothetical protein